MISVARAHRLIQDQLPVGVTASVGLADLRGRVLAEQITTPFELPRFDASAMDGFAVLASDVEQAAEHDPARLEVAGTIAAGAHEFPAVRPGTCVQIMTGAPLPDGADTVVPVEDTSGFESDPVSIYRPHLRGSHVRVAGEEVARGAVVMQPGMILTASEIGGLAALGLSSVLVFDQPEVAIFATGDELREPGEALPIGSIYDSNSAMLAAAVALSGGFVETSTRIADDTEQLRRTLSDALANSRLILLSGGVSMGKFDFVMDVLKNLGVTQIFWKVAQKPGKPLFFGVREQTMVFGLPGNPVSALVCFVEYVRPVIEQLQGRPRTEKLQAILLETFPVLAAKHRFLPGKVSVDGTRLLATPTTKRGSHMLTSAINANAIIEAPPGRDPLPAGATVDVNLMPGFRLV